MKKRKIIMAGVLWAAVSYNMGVVTFTTGNISRTFRVTNFEVGLLVSMTLIGWFFGSLIFGRVSDRKGRKIVVLLGTLIHILSTGAMGIFLNYISFLILRFMAGMGFGVVLPVLSAWVSEESPAKVRGRNVVILDSFWTYGWIIASLFAYLYLPSLGDKWYLYYYFSFLWLGVLPIILFMSELPKPLKFTKIGDLFQYRHTYFLWILWFSMALSYYGIFVWLPKIFENANHINSYEWVFISYLFQIPGFFTAAYLVERVGRKTVIISFAILTAISAYLFMIENFWILGASLISFFDLGAWGAMYAYTPELYPVNLKGTGTGFASSAGRIGGIIGPLIPGLLEWMDAYFIFIFFLLVASFSVLFMPETKKGVIS